MASYTSVSLMSTSAWNGPGSSPIISPSRWNALVADNLSVIRSHNHAASAGEGASGISPSFSPAIDTDYFITCFPNASTNWARGLMTGGTNNLPRGGVSTCTQGASISYSVYIRPGTYDISILTEYSTCGAGLTACLDGSPVASFGLFGTGSTINENATDSMLTTNFTTTLWGERTLVFNADSPIAGASGNRAKLMMISLVRRPGEDISPYNSLPSVSSGKVLTASYMNQLVDNMTELGIHQHSLSTGTSSFICRAQGLPVIAPSSLNFNTARDAGAFFGAQIGTGTSSSIASLVFPINLLFGIYTLDTLVDGTTSAGLASAIINGSVIGTVDAYVSPASGQLFRQITGINIPTSGNYTLTYRTDGNKNPSSSGSRFFFQAFQLRRTSS